MASIVAEQQDLFFEFDFDQAALAPETDKTLQQCKKDIFLIGCFRTDQKQQLEWIRVKVDEQTCGKYNVRLGKGRNGWINKENPRIANPDYVILYEFGNENAKPNGKMTKVPEELTFRKALSRTVIFTSTVVIDTEIIDKDLIYMPEIPSEDTATWWRILKEGHTAFGLQEPLVVYRRPANSLSSNKGVAVKRIWRLYREIAELNVIQSCWYLFRWAIRATFRRVVPRS